MKFTITNISSNLGAEWFKVFENKRVDIRGTSSKLQIMKESVDIEAKAVVFGEEGILMEAFVMDRELKVGGRTNFTLTSVNN